MKNFSTTLSLLFISAVLGLTFFAIMPRYNSFERSSIDEFSTERALKQVENISKKPHYVSSENHDVVANYLANELQKMGLETEIQEGFSFSEERTLTKSKNVLARIKGQTRNKALLLLSHYDSAPHTNSSGASDAGSGIATILEGIRAFIESKKIHKNDIIILLSDAEEIDMNGAQLFITKHRWAKDVGLAINFEARGTEGPSYMLMETNSGNRGLVKGFEAASVQYPLANSLMYSIYKMMPNFTDLNVIRKHGDIQGFNFAFIDGHYNYHTAQDDIHHIDRKSINHQGSYLMPLLDHFANIDLRSTISNEDFVYFSIPYSFISYPFAWSLPMVVISAAILMFLLFIGINKRLFSLSEIAKGWTPFCSSLIVAGLITYSGWKLLKVIYPQYNDFLNGFTYNGHDYIAAFTLLSLAICVAFYHLFSFEKFTMNHYVVPVFVWIIINLGIAYYLKGASFLIIPVYAGLVILGVFVFTQKSNWVVNLLMSVPILFIVAPLIVTLPIGLGLKILFASAIVTVLAFCLLLPIFGPIHRKGLLASLLLLLSIVFFAKAHLSSGYQSGKAKSNSIVYFINGDKNKAAWATYDQNLDQWTKQILGQNPGNAAALNTFNLESKYDTAFTYCTETTLKAISKPKIEFLADSVVENNRYLKIRITPTRKVNRYDIFAYESIELTNFKANGLSALGSKSSLLLENGSFLLNYYVVDQVPLEIEFIIAATSVLDLELFESSFDLLTNPLFSIPRRASWMMPTAFVVNDAVIIKQKIKPTPINNNLESKLNKELNVNLVSKKDSLKTQK